MNSFGLPRSVLVTVCLLTILASVDDASGADVPLLELQQICIGRDPNDAERSMAEVLRTSLRELYGANC